MDKIKKIDEFQNILEYFYYLKDALDDFNQKKNRAVSIDSKKFYSEQIDIIMKRRSSIRDVVLAKKEQIVHEKLSKIKDAQIKNFIKAKKEEKESISQKKLNLELEVALYKSIFELDDNFMAPIAKYANEYDCSDFFVTDEVYNKSFLVKGNNNEFEEYPATVILCKYLDNNLSLMDKLNKRHELKEEFLNDYIMDLKKQYPVYSDDKIKKMANDNLISHSPEFLAKLDNEYAFSTEEYDALAKAYSDFKTDYCYVKKEDLLKKESALNELTEDFNNLSKIPDGKNLEQYLLNKFETAEKQAKLIKSASDIIKSDSKIVSYFDKNNLLKDMKLSSETKLDYAKSLVLQHSLLEKIKDVEYKSQENADKIEEYENKLNTLKHSKSALSNIYTNENIINNVADIVDEYNTNFIIPLKEIKEEFSRYKNKNSQELSLVPYHKMGFLEKLTGFFNGRNKLQNEFNSRCQMYESKINVLTQKAGMHKPDYNFDDKLPLAKSIGQDIKDYLSKHQDASDIEACREVLEKYRVSLNKDIMSFKDNYRNYINELDDCSSYDDISNCVLDAINDIQNKLDIEKENTQNSKLTKKALCDEYNKNASMPITPMATIDYLNSIDNEFKTQLQKLSNYKGDNLDTLQYKAEIEEILKTDHSFLSNEEVQELDIAAKKKANSILNHAIDAYNSSNQKQEMDNDKLEDKKIVGDEIEL